MCNPNLHRHIGGCLPRHPEGPSLLEALTNTAHKVSTYISQLRDTCVPEQQSSVRTTVVATEFRDCERELNLSPSARSIHNFRRIQTSLGRMLQGPNRKRSLVSSGSRTTHHCHRTQSCFSRMDNTTAVAHVNNKGGTLSPQLVNLTLELWQDYLQRAILISGQHLPGKLYEVADRESRDFCDASEWQIDSQVIQPFIRKCNVDLVALRLTALLPTYAGWKPKPGATYTDAMTLDWSLLKGYAFPPFSLLAAMPRRYLITEQIWS